MKKVLPLFFLIAGLLLAVLVVFGRQIFVQHASIATFSNVAVNGIIFVDTNTNGIKDTGETAYTNTPPPIVRLALFSTTCSTPTPTLHPSGFAPSITPSTTPTPTPLVCPTGQHTICPKVACIARDDGTFVCPRCGCVGKGVLGDSTSVTIEANHVGTIAKEDTTNHVFGNSDVQQVDLCKTNPVQVVDCPIDSNGNYSCIVAGKTFTRATLLLNAPAHYIVTTHNDPYTIDAAVAASPAITVNFGIAQQNVPVAPSGCEYVACTVLCAQDNPNCCQPKLVCPSGTPTPTVTPAATCIPRPSCLATSTCPDYMQKQPASVWCAQQNTPLTNEQTTILLQFLNQQLRESWGK